MADARARFRLEGENAVGAAFNAAVKDAQGAANKMQGIFKTAFAAISVASVASALKNIAAHSIELGDELNKAAIKAGVGGKAISELAYAAKLADVDLSSLSTSLKFMQKAFSEAETGGKAQKLALDALGVSIANLKRLAPDKQFELIADRISQLKNPADRARAATELFGKAGADLLPLFEQGAEGIRKAREEAQKLGLSFNDEQIKRLADTDDAVKRMKASWEGLATALTAKVAPALTAVFTALTPGMDQLNADIASLEEKLRTGKMYGGNLSDEQKEIIRKNLANLKRQRDFRDLVPFTPTVKPMGSKTDQPPGYAAADAAQKSAEETSKIWTKLQEGMVKDNVETNDLIKRAWEDTTDKQGELLGGWQQVFDQTTEEMQRGWDNFTVHQRDKMDEMSEFAKQAARNMQDAFADFLFDPFSHGVKGMLKDFVDIIRRMLAEAAAAKVFDALFGNKSKSGSGGASGFLGGILGGLFGGGGGSGIGGNSIVQGENSWWSKIIKGAGSMYGGGGWGSVLGAIFGGGRAEGGPIEAGKWYIAGERGPEPIWGGGPGAFAAGYGRGGGPVSVTNHYDLRGSTPDVMATLPAILDRRDAQLKADIIGGLQRKKYSISR